VEWSEWDMRANAINSSMLSGIYILAYSDLKQDDYAKAIS